MATAEFEWPGSIDVASSADKDKSVLDRLVDAPETDREPIMAECILRALEEGPISLTEEYGALYFQLGLPSAYGSGEDEIRLDRLAGKTVKFLCKEGLVVRCGDVYMRPDNEQEPQVDGQSLATYPVIPPRWGHKATPNRFRK